METLAACFRFPHYGLEVRRGTVRRLPFALISNHSETQFAKCGGIDSQAALERAPKRVAACKTDCGGDAFDAFASEEQLPSCLVDPQCFDEIRRSAAEDTLEESAEMPGTQAGSAGQDIN
jgi:hypothetical protein